MTVRAWRRALAVAGPVVGVVAAVLALVSLTGSRSLMAVIGAIVGLSVVIALIPRPQVRITTSPLLRARVGEHVRQDVVIENPGRRTMVGCVVELHTPGLADGKLWCPSLAPGERAVCTLEREAIARGVSDISTAVALGWSLSGRSLVGNSGELAVRTIVQPAHARPDLNRQLAGTGEDHRSRPGGLDVTGVRRWSPGDSRRAVHWRATARHGELVVAERELPGGLVVRGLILGRAFDDEGEGALARLAATAVADLQAGRDVRVAWWVPSRGLYLAPTHSSVALLDWFAGPDARAARPVADLADVLAVLGSENPITVFGTDLMPDWAAALRRDARLVGSARPLRSGRR